MKLISDFGEASIDNSSSPIIQNEVLEVSFGRFKLLGF